MLIIVSYDVATSDKKGAARLRKIAKICTNHGQRVQYSVFECILDAAHYVAFKNELLSVYDPVRDSLRFYSLGNKYDTHIEHHGSKEVPNLEKDTLIL